MLFLIAKIVFLSLAAALFGAWLMYWWMSNRQEDVTESYSELKSHADGVLKRAEDLPTRTDLEDGVASLTSRIDNVQIPDLDPVRARLTSIEHAVSNITLPETDLSPVSERLQYLEAQISKPDPNFEHLHSRVTGLEKSLNYISNAVAQINLPEPDLSPVNARLDNLEHAVNGIQIPDVDLGPIHSSLALLELGIEGLDFPSTNLDPVHDHIRTLDAKLIELSERIDNARKSDIEVLTSRIASLSATLSGLKIPEVEPALEHVHAKLNKLEGQITDIGATPHFETDLSPVLLQMDRLENRVAAPRADIETLNARLGALEISLSEVSGALTGLTPPNMQPFEQKLDRMAAIGLDQDGARRAEMDILASRISTISKQIDEARTQPVDLRPVQDSLAGLETAVRSIDRTQVDMGPVVLRLNELETVMQGLRGDIGAVHDIDRKLTALDRAGLDLSPVQARLAGLESSLGDVRNDFQALQIMIRESRPTDVLERKLGSLETALHDLKLQKQSIDVDYGPVLDVVYKMDSRLMDLNAVENRLTSMEYGLAAVHDMLRSRSDAVEQRSEIYRRVDTDPAPVRYERREVTRGTDYEQADASRSFRTSYVGDIQSTQLDPIRPAVREGDRANLLVDAAFGPADDLELISGIGPMLSALLNNIGVFYFWQIAEWGPQEIVWVDDQLKHFKGRIERDSWVRQARDRLSDPTSARRPA